MSNDNSTGDRDSRRVLVTEDFQVEHFAREHHLSVEEVRELIKQFGSDQERLEDAVKAMHRPEE
jgi:hypothetical protein